ncbi:hypothetical protein G3M48_001783, partial [Beauveria asiatica]
MEAKRGQGFLDEELRLGFADVQYRMNGTLAKSHGDEPRSGDQAFSGYTFLASTATSFTSSDDFAHEFLSWAIAEGSVSSSHGDEPRSGDQAFSGYTFLASPPPSHTRQHTRGTSNYFPRCPETGTGEVWRRE